MSHYVFAFSSVFSTEWHQLSLNYTEESLEVQDPSSCDKVPENAAFYGIDQDIIIPGAPQVKRYFTKHYITAFLF